VKKEYYCMDCGKLLDQIDGIIEGSIRTDGDITKYTFGNMFYGNILGYICCACCVKSEEDAE